MVIARAAVEQAAIIVTWDHHFRKLASRPHFDALSVITFSCAEADGKQRAQALIEAIEFHYGRSHRRGEKRLLIDVMKAVFRVMC